MNVTLLMVEKMLAAIEAQEYDIGVLSDRGMLPGLSNLPHEAVLSRLPLLRAQNARGAHIYVRPSGSHRYTVLDDLQRCSVERLISDGFEPCAVIETSPANFQAWLKHSEVFPKELASPIAKRNIADKMGYSRSSTYARARASRFDMRSTFASRSLSNTSCSGNSARPGYSGSGAGSQ